MALMKLFGDALVVVTDLLVLLVEDWHEHA